MSQPASLEPPPTIDVVAVDVAEQLVAAMHQRLSELEARLEATEREAEEAEEADRTVCRDPDPGFVAVARNLLQQASELRDQATARRAPTEAAGTPNPLLQRRAAGTPVGGHDG